MEEYKGKIIGEQRDCCEDNRIVLEVIVDDDGEIVLVVQCKVCERKWIEVLD